MTWIALILSIIVIFVLTRFVSAIIQGYNLPINSEKRIRPYGNKDRIINKENNLATS